MKDELKALFDRLGELQLQYHEFLFKLQGGLARMSIEDMVDVGFLCRESAKAMDDVRKACTAKQEMVGRVIATIAGGEAMRGNVLKLEGELATATPDVVNKPRIPDKGTDDYVKLLRWIGVPDHVIESQMVKPSFSQLQEVLSKRLAAGEQLPPGISVAYTEATAVFRTKARKVKDEKGQDF